MATTSTRSARAASTATSRRKKRHTWRIVVLTILGCGVVALGVTFALVGTHWGFLDRLRQGQQVQTVAPAPNGTTVSDGIGEEGRIQRAVTRRFDPIDEMDQKFEKLLEVANVTNSSVKLLQEQGIKLHDQVDQIDTKVAKVEKRVAALEMKPAQPAATGQSQSYSPPLGPLGPQSNAAPQQPAQVARNEEPDRGRPQMNEAETNFFVPKGFHLDPQEMDSKENIEKMHSCRAPRHLEIDRDSPKCHASSERDPRTGLPIRLCPNKCV